MAAPNITKLGFLNETDTDVASVRERPKYVTFPHKLMQEFSAALFISHTLKEATNMKVNLFVYFSQSGIIITGRERLIRSHSSARFSFELSGNSN